MYVLVLLTNHCTFAETYVHVCDFHRKKAWNEWVSKTSNGVSESRDEVLQYLSNIAKKLQSSFA